MAKKDRTGNRKKRDQRKQFKVPELGYYLIVTDTEATECCFFTGLHQALPEDVRNDRRALWGWDNDNFTKEYRCKCNIAFSNSPNNGFWKIWSMR